MQEVSLDPEHAAMLVKAQKAQGEKPAYAPPMSEWSLQNELLATVIDEIRGLRHIELAVNSKSKPKPPMPYPRPRTALERAKVRDREAAHKALVARVLPHKAK